MRGGGGVGSPVAATPTTCSGRCSSWAGPTTTWATWTRCRRVRGERARGRADGRRHHAGRRRRPGVGPGLGAVRAGRPGARLRGTCRPSAARSSPRRSPWSAASTGSLRPGRAGPRPPRGGRGLRPVPRSGRHARTCTCPRALARRARAAVLLAAGDEAGAEQARMAAERPRRRRGPPAGRLRPRAARTGAGRGWEREPGRRRCCARPSGSWTSAARSGCATRCGANCASWAPGRDRAARPPARTPAWAP